MSEKDVKNSSVENTENVKEDVVNEQETNNLTDSSPVQELDESNDSKDKKGFSFSKKKKSKNDNEKQIQELKTKIEELNDKHIRLQAEFDNYKKRTLKEKSDLLRYGGETALVNLLPIIDDFERGLKSIEKTPDDDPIKAGMLLIYNKFKEYITRQGIKEIDCSSGIFNVEEHEAITRFPAPTEELKGKIVDAVEKGYYYHDKVIRFAKVVIGE